MQKQLFYWEAPSLRMPIEKSIGTRKKDSILADKSWRAIENPKNVSLIWGKEMGFEEWQAASRRWPACARAPSAQEERREEAIAVFVASGVPCQR